MPSELKKHIEEMISGAKVCTEESGYDGFNGVRTAKITLKIGEETHRLVAEVDLNTGKVDAAEVIGVGKATENVRNALSALFAQAVQKDAREGMERFQSAKNKSQVNEEEDEDVPEYEYGEELKAKFSGLEIIRQQSSSVGGIKEIDTTLKIGEKTHRLTARIDFRAVKVQCAEVIEISGKIQFIQTPVSARFGEAIAESSKTIKMVENFQNQPEFEKEEDDELEDDE